MGNRDFIKNFYKAFLDYFELDIGIKEPHKHLSYGETSFKMIKETEEEGVKSIKNKTQ